MADDTKVTFDECLESKGGFGRFQWFSSITIILAYTSGNYIVYTLGSFLLLPQFQCSRESSPDIWFECEHKEFCDNGEQLSGVNFRVDWDSIYSLRNWIEPLDLYCISSFKMGLFGSLYFAGFAFGCLTVVRLGDVYGRKWVLFSALVG